MRRQYKTTQGYVTPSIAAMFAYGVVLFACLQVISSEFPTPPNVPEECRRPPEGTKARPHECCKMPKFFKEEDFEQCGFKKPDPEAEPPHPPHPRPPMDCSKQICMLEKYNMAKDGEVDKEAVAAFMDKQGEENPDFKEAIDAAKEICLKADLPGPPNVCEAIKIMFCVHGTMIDKCQNWEQTDDCKALKEHIDHCKPFFKKP